MPLPDSPVMTTSRSRGNATVTSLRLCSRAPRTTIRSRGMVGTVYRTHTKPNGCSCHDTTISYAPPTTFPPDPVGTKSSDEMSLVGLADYGRRGVRFRLSAVIRIRTPRAGPPLGHDAPISDGRTRTDEFGPGRSEGVIARRCAKSQPYKASTLSRRSFVWSGSSESFQFSVPAFCRADFTWAGDADGLPALNSAAAPATCGVAIDVPLIVL